MHHGEDAKLHPEGSTQIESNFALVGKRPEGGEEVAPRVQVDAEQRVEAHERGETAPRHALRLHSQCKNNCLTEMWSGSEEGSYLRLIDWCITQF